MHHIEVTPGKSKATRNIPFKLALAGNPNAGKTSIFNLLTGMNQKVGNFPGVTVEKKTGKFLTTSQEEIHLIDFPGTYSLYPNSLDERIVVQTFSNPNDVNYPDGILYIADVTKLEQHILLLSQLLDLGLPVILVLNMIDLAEKGGLNIEAERLSDYFQIPVIPVSSRSGKGKDQLIESVEKMVLQSTKSVQEKKPFVPFDPQETKVINAINKRLPHLNAYQALLVGHHSQWLKHLSAEEQDNIHKDLEHIGFEPLRHQIKETMKRYDRFTPIVKKSLKKSVSNSNSISFTERLDYILTHPFWGTVFFIFLMLIVFQAIYTLATYPMDWIEQLFGFLNTSVKSLAPGSWITNLIADGLIAGLGGIMVFIPQIAILFFLISLLEEAGYMARAAFLFDRTMQFFGLNGRSVVALISGGACAVPAIMSTRNIANWKERMITIMVTPLISCSARIPVYAVLIALVIPSTTVLGIFNLQGLVFMGLYLLGIIAALLSALVFKLILRSEETSYLMLELPEYRVPVIRNVWLTVLEKVRSFIVEAGKVILIISLILWVLASFGPGNAMENAALTARQQALQQNLSESETNDLISAKKIEASFAGQLGKMIEPAIQPLGFDWKIGIALITSFAAREVFVGTMATIYSIGSVDDDFSIKEKMAKEINPKTGKPVYTLATSLSLLLFYVFAMQCMSTLAVVKRETNSWKWPIIQFVFMSALAYICSLIIYQVLK